jgi:uncharacterized protein (DUF305 family)
MTTSRSGDGTLAAAGADRPDVDDLSFDQLLALQALAGGGAGDDAVGDGDGDDDGEGDGGGSDDDASRATLPWWRSRLNLGALAVTIALVAGMVGFMAGQETSGPDAGEVDIGFLQDMRGHHEQAVQMGFIFLTVDDTHPGLRTIARSIIFGQGIDIGRMVQLLRSMGAAEVNESGAAMTWMGMSSAVDDMPGMATRDRLLALGNATGAEADALFVELMTAHHLGGIDMARFAAERALHPEVRAMAASMAMAQRGEIAEMEGLLASSGS